jgi:hypothetical protein
VYLEKWYNTSDYITSESITLTTLDLPPRPTLTLTTTWNNVDAGAIVLTYKDPQPTVVVNYKLEGASTYTTYTLWLYVDGNTIIPGLPAGAYVVQLIYTYTYEDGTDFQRQTEESTSIVNVLAKATWDEENTRVIVGSEGNNALDLHWFSGSWGNGTPTQLELIVTESETSITSSIFLTDTEGSFDITSYRLSTWSNTKEIEHTREIKPSTNNRNTLITSLGNFYKSDIANVRYLTGYTQLILNTLDRFHMISVKKYSLPLYVECRLQAKTYTGSLLLGNTRYTGTESKKRMDSEVTDTIIWGSSSFNDKLVGAIDGKNGDFSAATGSLMDHDSWYTYGAYVSDTLIVLYVDGDEKYRFSSTDHSFPD